MQTDSDVLKLAHTSVFSHMGPKKTLERIKYSFFGRWLEADVKSSEFGFDRSQLIQQAQRGISISLGLVDQHTSQEANSFALLAKFNATQKWATLRRRPGAVVYGLNKFDKWILRAKGGNVLINPLKYLINHTKSPKLTRWVHSHYRDGISSPIDQIFLFLIFLCCGVVTQPQGGNFTLRGVESAPPAATRSSRYEDLGSGSDIESGPGKLGGG
ncbi:hypothetical protein NPIL_372541 [Nephila pilipes]|uniref:Uncharacterized protein n=1 Tax=Nephila pilipes TaxID=299642 RepID=A0A8X6QC21_NEPPI|nr:hypothetical protein NPIL_372541 [Nephila pilipes]